MTLTFNHVRIGQIGVESSSAAIDGDAVGPFGGIARSFDYEELFAKALAGGGQAKVPWSGKSLRGNRFWKKYITARLARADPGDWPNMAWKAMVPLKPSIPLPAVHLHPGEARSYGEACVWPTGIGICWNSWIETALGVDDLVDILKRIRNDEVDRTDSAGTTVKTRMKTIYHQTLDQVRDTCLGTKSEGSRSELITVVTIVRATWEGPQPASPEAALKMLLDGVQKVWGERPAIAKEDRHEATGHTVYVAKGLRLVWLPDSFLDPGQIHRCGCLHRNLVAASLQAELLAETAILFAELRQQKGSLPPAYAPFVEVLLERIDFFLTDRGYSAPFLHAQLDRGPVKAALKVLADA